MLRAFCRFAFAPAWNTAMPAPQPDTPSDTANAFNTFPLNAPALAAQRSKWSLRFELLRVWPPYGWMVLIWPTLAALWLAARGWPGVHLFAVFALGSVLMHGAGCCVNDVADRDFDRCVKRTIARPVTSGQLSVCDALATGAAVSIFCFCMALTTNWLLVIWSVPALLITIAYPFSKRFFAMPQAVLGAAFGFGIPMAFAAVHGSVPIEALWLYLGKIALVLGYDTEYAMVDREDDLKIGLKTTAITLGRFDVAGIMAFFCTYWLVWLAVIARHMAAHPPAHPWTVYLGFAAAAAQIVWHYFLIRTRTRAGCFKAFCRSPGISFAVFAGLVLAYV